jgi:hypothetical protein
MLPGRARLEGAGSFACPDSSVAAGRVLPYLGLYKFDSESWPVRHGDVAIDDFDRWSHDRLTTRPVMREAFKDEGVRDGGENVESGILGDGS